MNENEPIESCEFKSSRPGTLESPAIPRFATTYHANNGEVFWFSFGRGRGCNFSRSAAEATDPGTSPVPSWTERVPDYRERV